MITTVHVVYIQLGVQSLFPSLSLKAESVFSQLSHLLQICFNKKKLFSDQ